MNPISVPYHLVIATALFTLILLLTVILRKRFFISRKKKRFWISAVVFLVVYLLIVSSAIYEDIDAQIDLNSFDLDGDGFFSESESTPEQENAMFRLVNDFGRNISFITALFISFIISLTFYFIKRSIGFKNNKRKINSSM